MNSEVLLDFKNVSKTFGSCIANQNISFSVQASSIHALVGENGAGKSTIMKILFGLYQKDQGEIFYRREKIEFSSPLEAKKQGFGMVHQHFMLAGPMTALEHFFLDESEVGSLFRPLNKNKMRQELKFLSEKYGMPVNWDEKIENLSVGFQQRIEILKLLRNRAEVLILDEPTAVLTPQEIQNLFAQLRELKAAGKTILLITHKLKEVIELADQVTVFRQGRSLQTLKVKETSIQEISELMVDRKMNALKYSSVSEQKKITLELKSVTVPTLGLKNLSLRLHSREILGMAGVEGNGQSQLIDFLLHPARYSVTSGELLYEGQSLLNESPAHLKARGFSFFPEDRLQQGVMVDMKLWENFLLGQHHNSEFQSHGILRGKQIQACTEAQMKKFDVRPLDSEMSLQNLSGGNQQKLVVARELYRQPHFLLAAQPTRGVDIGATELIHQEMLKLRDRGASIFLISSDLDQLMQLADRMVIIFRGQLVGEMNRQDFNEMRIGRLMNGVLD